MRWKVNWFNWEGEFYWRANFWDAEGRYSTHTFLSEGEASGWINGMMKPQV